jgi:hypothetical protein
MSRPSLAFVGLMTPVLGRGCCGSRGGGAGSAESRVALPGLVVVGVLSFLVAVVASPGPEYQGMLFDPFTFITWAPGSTMGLSAWAW